nr:hypothetical protein [Streptococcus panodentis]
MDKRFSKRRRDGVDLFWLDERKRLMNGEVSSRAWTSSQRQDIIDGKNQHIMAKHFRVITLIVLLNIHT